MALYPCLIGGGGGGGGGASSITRTTRIIEGSWDGTGSTTYTFNRDIDYCFIFITFTREKGLEDTRYSLTLSQGTYALSYDSGAVYGATTCERVVCLIVSNIKVGDTLYLYNYGDQRTADMVEFVPTSGKNAIVRTGTFVTASSQYGVANVVCGFEPDLVIVTLPFSNGDTTSYWWRYASWAQTSAVWCLAPAESSFYVVPLDRMTGETGIRSINGDGFSFMSNGSNTLGVTCQYIACKYV